MDMNISTINKKLIAITLKLLMISLFSFGQSKPDYVRTDSAYKQGFVSRHGMLKVAFRESKKVPWVFFSPAEVNEYRFDGDLYQSLSFDGSDKFYLLLTTGNTSLYKGRKHYLLKKQDSLIKFQRRNFKAVLKKSTKFDGRETTLSRLSYTKASLRRFVDQCNKGVGNSDKLNYKKIGVTVAYGQLKFTSQLGNESTISNQVDQSVITVGLFGDFPLLLNRSLYLSTELLFVKAKPTFYNETPNSSYYTKLDLSGVMIPISLKLISENGKRIRPYAKAGGVVTILAVDSPTGVLNNKVINSSTIEVAKDNILHNVRPFYGFTIDAGIEINNGKRKNIHLGLRYEKTFFNTSFSNVMSVGYSGLSIKLGYTI